MLIRLRLDYAILRFSISLFLLQHFLHIRVHDGQFLGDWMLRPIFLPC
jgi:hypothetical protein